MKWLLALALLPLLASAQTVTPSCSAVITCQPITLPVSAPVPTPTPVPTPVPVPVGKGFTVYADGQLNWQGDFSYPAPPIQINYKDTSGAPTVGTYDALVDPKGAQWAAWQPYANNPVQSWSTAPYTQLTMQLKPTTDGQVWQIQFLLAGDTALPGNCSKSLNAYGPAPIKGKWATYTVPLADLCVKGVNIYKFAVQSISGVAPWYVNSVRFDP